MTNKISGETKAKLVPWSKVLAMDLKPQQLDGVFFHEPKKVLVCCDIADGGTNDKNLVYYTLLERAIKSRQLDFAVEPFWPFFFTYVQSLTQIQQCVGGQRKRGE